MEDTKKKQQFGFSFIELLIVIAIMAILFSVTSANYRDFQSRRSLDNAQTLVMSDLRLAQQYARSGKKPPGCSVLHGYKLIFDGSGSYMITAECDVDINVADRQINNISISGNSVRFNVLGRGTSLADGSSVTITISDSTNDRLVVISSSGNIE